MNIPQGPYRSEVCFDSVYRHQPRRIQLRSPQAAHSTSAATASKAICCKYSRAAPVRDSLLPRMQLLLQKHLPTRLVLILACSPLLAQSFVGQRCEARRR